MFAGPVVYNCINGYNWMFADPVVFNCING